MSNSRLIDKLEVLRRLGCKKTKLWEMIKSGHFPPPIQLPLANGKPGRKAYWPESVVDSAIESFAAAERVHILNIASSGLHAAFSQMQAPLKRRSVGEGGAQ